MNFRKPIAVHRAQVSPEYAAAINQIYKKGIAVARRRMSEADKKMFEFLRSISTEEGKEREAIRLRTLDSENFTAIDYNGEDHLVGLTRPLEVVKNSGAKFHPGRYYVFIPSSAIIDISPSRVHLLPQARPKTPYRHPHHYAETADATKNPLSFTPRTCMGSFNGMMSGLYSLMDITGIWQAWHMYLCRWNESSEYCRHPDLHALMRGEYAN